MRIEIRIDRGCFRRWHGALRDGLTRKISGAEVRFRLEAGDNAAGGAVAALLALERLVLRRSRESYADPRPLDEATPRVAADFVPEVIVDCTGSDEPASYGDAALVLQPRFDGLAPERAMIAALLSGAMPEIAIEDRRSGAILAWGVASAETADGLSGGMEAVLSRVISLLERVLLSPRQSFDPGVKHRPAPQAAAVARFAARTIAMDCARAIYHLCVHSPHWRVGWRLNDGPGVLERGDLAGPRWQVLADPGTRFFADPFPVEWQGRTFVFFEDLDHRIGKGIISAIEFKDGGPRGEAIPVLEEPWHLSYPFIMLHEGALWMIPESSLSGAVPIYRCTAFPLRWERVGTLLEGVEAADATVFRHDGLFWMTSAVREGVGGYSDSLAIHYASDLMGPWQEHEQRPVLIDAAMARPAGAVVRRNGQLWRPVQDCTSGYGHALGLARIDRLDREHFSQSLQARLPSGPLWPGGRIHTLNRCGRLECIDGVLRNPRIGALRPFATARMAPRGGDQDVPTAIG